MKEWLRGLLGQKRGTTGRFVPFQEGNEDPRSRSCQSLRRNRPRRALDGDTIVFVEVRTRRSTDAGHPAETITPQKQSRLTRAALAYLKHNKLLDHRSRFDVVAILWPDGSKSPQIEHYKNAFEPTGSGQFFS